MSIGNDLDQALLTLQSAVMLLTQQATTNNTVPFTGFKNLHVYCNPATSKINVSFDGAILKDASNNRIEIGAASFIIDPATVGLNGMDAGALAGLLHWYYFHIVSDGTNVGGVLSLSDTAPILPNGYTYSLFGGVAQTNTTTQISLIGFIQRDNRINFQDRGVLKVPGVAATVANVYQSLDLTEYVPPMAKTISGFMGSVAPRDMAMAISPLGSDIGRINANAVGYSVAYDGFGCTAPFSDMVLQNPQSMYWKSVDTIARNVLYLTGFTI